LPDIGFPGDLVVVRSDVERLVEIDRVDLVLIDELHKVDGALRLELDVVNLLIIEQDVFALLDFIAAHDLVGVDGADTGNDLLVADPLPGRLVDLVERNPGCGLRCREQLDRDRHQSQSDLTRPIRARGHTRLQSHRTHSRPKYRAAGFDSVLQPP
jgi:hypothetical protein